MSAQKFVLNYHGESLSIDKRDLHWIIDDLNDAYTEHRAITKRNTTTITKGAIHRAPELRDSTTEPEPPPVGMDYISEDGYLHTWDGKAWRNDGPVSNETRICLRMIRALTDRIVTLEGKLQ